MTFDDFYNYLLNLCDKLSHETNEQAETIDELQNKLKCAVDANKSFIKRMAKQTREINALYKEIEQQKTEINRLKLIIALNDDENKDLKKEIERLTELIDIRDDVCTDLVNEIKDLQTELTDATNDNAGIKKENKNLRKNIEYLCDENIRLRHELNEVKSHDRNY